MSHNIISINAINYIQLFGYAVVTGVIVVAIYGFTFIVLNKKMAKDLIQIFKKN